MKRTYSNGILSFWTTYRNEDICLYQIDIKKPFEYETEKIDGQTIDTVIKNDKYDTVLYFISNKDRLIVMQSVVVGAQEASYPVVMFDEKKYIPAIQNDYLIFITSYKNLLKECPLVKECTNSLDWQFLQIPNTCEIYTNPNFRQTQYHNTRTSLTDSNPNYFHFNADFEEVYANYCECDGRRISRWTYNVGQKDEYFLTKYDDTDEYFIYYTNPIKRLKYNLMKPKTLAILGALAIVSTAAVKCSCHNHIPEPREVKPAKSFVLPSHNIHIKD